MTTISEIKKTMQTGKRAMMSAAFGILTVVSTFADDIDAGGSGEYVPTTGGGVNYTGGADRLIEAHNFVMSALIYVRDILFVIGALVALFSATQIYIKMNVGEDGVKKSIMMLVGACIFMIAISIIFPAFFGYTLYEGGSHWGNFLLSFFS